MNKPMAVALLAIGLILLIFGLNATESIGSAFSGLFTGAPTDKAIWLLIGGVLGIVVGLLTLARSRRA